MDLNKIKVSNITQCGHKYTFFNWRIHYTVKHPVSVSIHQIYYFSLFKHVTVVSFQPAFCPLCLSFNIYHVSCRALVTHNNSSFQGNWTEVLDRVEQKLQITFTPVTATLLYCVLLTFGDFILKSSDWFFFYLSTFLRMSCSVLDSSWNYILYFYCQVPCKMDNHWSLCDQNQDQAIFGWCICFIMSNISI